MLTLLAIATLAAATAPNSARSEAEAAAAAKAMAECYLRTQADRVEKHLLADPATLSFEKWEDGRSSDCLFKVVGQQGVWAVGGGDWLRYALAEALVHSRLNGAQLNDLDRVAPLKHDRQPYPKRYKSYHSRAEREQIDQQFLAGNFLSKMGECVVRGDPINSRALLDAEPVSAAEQGVVQSLMPVLQSCVDKSQTLAFDRASLRGAIALNYLRLAKAPRVTVQEAAE